MMATGGGAHEERRTTGSCRSRVGDSSASAAEGLADVHWRGVLGTDEARPAAAGADADFFLLPAREAGAGACAAWLVPASTSSVGALSGAAERALPPRFFDTFVSAVFAAAAATGSAFLRRLRHGGSASLGSADPTWAAGWHSMSTSGASATSADSCRARLAVRFRHVRSVGFTASQHTDQLVTRHQRMTFRGS